MTLTMKEKDDRSLALFNSGYFQTKGVIVGSVLFFSWCSCNTLPAKNVDEFCFQTEKKPLGKPRFSEVIRLSLDQVSGTEQLLFPF